MRQSKALKICASHLVVLCSICIHRDTGILPKVAASKFGVLTTGTFIGASVSYLQTMLDAGRHDHTSTSSCLQDTGITRHLPYVLLCEELKGAVASTFVAFTMPPSNVEYNCLVNEIMDPSGGCYTMYMEYFGDVSLGHIIRWPKTSVIL
ncbi:hypothetical protein MKW98_003927 [Papaver atlanticum]|uniref:Uncharacterized protein n=1 Tax=Papaver atlanticum TaxID=357466 RepID=A0AAD4XHN8_9MAGN|nr:hypothetical protein MKW98_003927 [Papaver atlanticum]